MLDGWLFSHKDGENEQMIWGSARFEMVAQIYGKIWYGLSPTLGIFNKEIDKTS